LNAVADADVLYVLGRPQAPTAQVLALAHALHPGAAPLLPDLVLRQVPYPGYRGPDGRGRAFEVLSFADVRVDAVFEQPRTAEFLQCLHRARPFRVGELRPASADTVDATGVTAPPSRERLDIVLITNQPVPGLPVHELICATPEQEQPDRNDQRQAEAEERIRGVIARRRAAGDPITVNAVARDSHADKRTVSRVLSAEARFDRGGGHATEESAIYRLHRPDQTAGCPEPLRTECRPTSGAIDRGAR
jgi:hypothetical protein